MNSHEIENKILSARIELARSINRYNEIRVDFLSNMPKKPNELINMKEIIEHSEKYLPIWTAEYEALKTTHPEFTVKPLPAIKTDVEIATDVADYNDFMEGK
ncbi:MAG TPA: hypothetical protein PLI96_11305 [Halothiobacillus sp.]|nr:hypothetical protein [Halothiobacillus sp.]